MIMPTSRSLRSELRLLSAWAVTNSSKAGIATLMERIAALLPTFSENTTLSTKSLCMAEKSWNKPCVRSACIRSCRISIKTRGTPCGHSSPTWLRALPTYQERHKGMKSLKASTIAMTGAQSESNKMKKLRPSISASRTHGSFQTMIAQTIRY
jgi:hypothetical protein